MPDLKAICLYKDILQLITMFFCFFCNVSHGTKCPICFILYIQKVTRSLNFKPWIKPVRIRWLSSTSILIVLTVDIKLTHGFYRICNYISVWLLSHWSVNTWWHLNHFPGVNINYFCIQKLTSWALYITSAICCRRLQRECVMPVDCETHDPRVRGLAEACMSETLPPSTLKRQTISESTGRTEKLSGWGEHSHLELSWLQHCASSLLQCSCPYCHGYSVIMLPSSLMFSWLLLDVWAGFPL